MSLGGIVVWLCLGPGAWSGDNGESNLGRSGCGGAESGEDYVVWCENVPLFY